MFSAESQPGAFMTESTKMQSEYVCLLKDTNSILNELTATFKAFVALYAHVHGLEISQSNQDDDNDVQETVQCNEMDEI